MFKFKVLGNYAPNMRGLPGSSYLLKGFSRPILLDMGNGNCHKAIKEIGTKNLNNTILILSHNHVDHSWDVLKLGKYLKRTKSKITIYLPHKSLMYLYIKNSKYYNVNIINEKTTFKIDGYKVSFCQTFHRGECYATKFEKEDESFVYTSDMSYMSRGLMGFCKNANSVLIDSGFPHKRHLYLRGYHGNTKEILDDLFSNDCNAKKVYASHLKACLKDKDYTNVFPYEKNVEIVKMENEYNMF